ncbi:hypothetical protein SALBM135S_02451 [Streptomyces alboniger]
MRWTERLRGTGAALATAALLAGVCAAPAAGAGERRDSRLTDLVNPFIGQLLHGDRAHAEVAAHPVLADVHLQVVQKGSCGDHRRGSAIFRVSGSPVRPRISATLRLPSYAVAVTGTPGSPDAPSTAR